MALTVDLREHFGIWEHCPRSTFWRQVFEPNPDRPEIHVYVSPLEGVMIVAQEHLASRGRAFRVSVRRAYHVDDEAWQTSTRRVAPWVWSTLSEFFTVLTILQVSRGDDPAEIMKMIKKVYKKQSKEFIRTGKGHQDPGLDELLAATRAFLVDVEGSTVLKKTILKDELPEFLEEYGIQEC